MLKWAHVHTYFKDVAAPESDEEDEDVDDVSEGSDGEDVDGDADEAELLITQQNRLKQPVPEASHAANVGTSSSGSASMDIDPNAPPA